MFDLDNTNVGQLADDDEIVLRGLLNTVALAKCRYLRCAPARSKTL